MTLYNFFNSYKFESAKLELNTYRPASKYIRTHEEIYTDRRRNIYSPVKNSFEGFYLLFQMFFT